MSSLRGVASIGNRLRRRRDDLRGVIDRQRGLRDEGQPARIAHVELLHVRDVLDEMDVAAEGRIEPAHRALHFRMARVPDEDHVARVARVPMHFHMHLRHQRTRGIEHAQLAARWPP